MVKFAVEFWWKMVLTIFPAKAARKSPSKLRQKFATNFAENFANFTLEIAGAYHPFQNHYTHKKIIFELFRSLQLQFLGPTGINFRYSYSFGGPTGILSLQLQFVSSGASKGLKILETSSSLETIKPETLEMLAVLR